MKTFIDLSLPICATPSEATPVTITAVDHRDAPKIFGLEREDFPDGMGISNEYVEITTHTGTHMDAPLHYGPLSQGQPARAIHEIPLSWCYGRGIRLDLRHCGPGEGISAAEVETAVAQTGTQLSPLDIVLIWTGCDRLWGSKAYLTDYPGLTRQAVAYLVQRGIRVIGIDAWGLDRPMEAMLRDYRETVDPLFSTGVFLALRGASLAAEAVDSVLKEPGKESELLQRYEESYQDFFDVVISFVHYFYDASKDKKAYWERAQQLIDPIQEMTSRRDFVRLISGQAGISNVMRLNPSAING